MGKAKMDPDIADEVPWSDHVTEYDEEHFITYLRLLDAVGAKPAEHVVEPGTSAHELGFGRAFQVRTPEPCRALKAAVLVEHDARRHERRPGQIIREGGGTLPVFGQVQHARKALCLRCRASTAMNCGSRLAA